MEAACQLAGFQFVSIFSLDGDPGAVNGSNLAALAVQLDAGTLFQLDIGAHFNNGCAVSNGNDLTFGGEVTKQQIEIVSCL